MKLRGDDGRSHGHESAGTTTADRPGESPELDSDARSISLKIGILGCRGYPSTYGGFETFVRHLAPYLAERGHDVAVYCRGDESQFVWRKAYHDNVSQIFTPGWSTKSASTLSYGFTSAIDTLWRRFDIVLVLNIANGFYLPIITKGKTKGMVNVDGLEWQRGKWGGLGKRIFRLGAKASARFADDIIVDSRAMSDEWRKILGRGGTYIPYGADLVIDRPTSRIDKLGLRPRRYCLAVARLAPENNVELIMDAFEQADLNSPLVVVGSSNYDNTIVRRLQSSAQDHRIRWLGHVSDQELLTDLWAHCGAYLHGHSVGGTNPALLQALGAGSPTLALDTPFNREVICKPEMMFGSTQELSSKLAQLMSNRRQQDMWAEHGRRRIADAYTWATVCDAYLGHFMALIGATST